MDQAEQPPAPASNRSPRAGRSRRKLFLLLMQSGAAATPEEAFVKAGFPVVGVNVPSGAKGWYPEQVPARARQLLEKQSSLEFIQRRSVPPDVALKWLVPDSIEALEKGLNAKLKDGRPDWATITRCAENILDRSGHPRRQTVKTEHTHEHKITGPEALQQVREVIELERDGDRFLPKRKREVAA